MELMLMLLLGGSFAVLAVAVVVEWVRDWSY
jgi:hypothetical protein